jgi:hypothetical protein
MKEAAKVYYSSRVRRVKTARERIHSSATAHHHQQPQPLLNVRYCLKLAYFHEVRRDYVAAISQYDAALEGMRKEVRGRGSEVRAVAAYAIYRLCRLHLLRGEGTEAKVAHAKVVETFPFGWDPDSLELPFEHAAWLEQL